MALSTLLPLSIAELRKANLLPQSYQEAIFKGFYPRIYQADADPVVFAESYVRTYIERDVRDMKNIASLSDFQKFMRLCAARSGQLLNLSSLAVDSGLSTATVKSWLSILEASYIIFLLQPYHVNFNKRVVKMPKLYFYDSSLVCNLLRLTSPEEVLEHYLRGGLFETMVISDLVKNRTNEILPPNAYFWRDKTGHEVDCLLEEGSKIKSYEIKSTSTISSDLFDGLKQWSSILGIPTNESSIVYGGSESQKRGSGHVLSWKQL